MRVGRRKRLIVLAGVGVAAAAWLWPRLPRPAARALATADRYELFSIDPAWDAAHAPGDFHGHQVLGRTTVADRPTMDRLGGALRGGVAPVYTSRPKCFNPRLGVRLATGDRVTDFVICFGCKQAWVWQDDRVVGDWTTDRTPQPAFDDVLRAAGVPLPPAD